MDRYEYPDELYCNECDADVKPDIVDRIERMKKMGEDIDVPYKAAVCPKCGAMLCDRDLEYAIIEIARKDGLL